MASVTFDELVEMLNEIEPNIAILLDKDQDYFWYIRNKLDGNLAISQKEAQGLKDVHTRMINMQYSG